MNVEEDKKQSHKYDVAISFCHEDEDLALELAGRLVGLRTFIYPKAQEQLAGTDGLESFRSVFRNECLLAIVLHRDKWGTTPWTRVEDTAIKEMCLEAGWNHLLFVRTAGSSEVPKWVPETHLYLDLKTYSTEELVGAIKSACQRVGSQIVRETSVEKARRIGEAIAFEEETERLLGSQAGVQQANQYLQLVFDETKSCKEAIQASGIDLFIGGSTRAFVIRAGQMSGVVRWDPYANNTKERPVKLESYRGLVLTPEESRAGRFSFDKPVSRSSETLEWYRTRSLGICLRDSKGITYSTDQVAEKIISWFLNEYKQINSEKHYP